MLKATLSAALAVTLTASVTASMATAQSSDDEMAPAPRLTVRPHQMATGTRTAEAGLKDLPGFPGYKVYVPQKCVGTQRCPLIVLLHGGGRSADMEIQKFSTLADKYGVIVLLPNASNPGQWDMIYGGMNNASRGENGLKVSSLPMRDMRLIDSSMKLILRQDAIDPDRIALLGFSDGGSSSLLVGRSNLDIFSRVAGLSALIPFDGTGPVNPKTQFIVSGGLAEDMVGQTLKMAQVLRHEGHPVVTLLGLRGHVDKVVDEDFVWKWLMQSWPDPSITLHPPLPADASDPVLTVDAMQKMTDFWTRFKQEPDSVLNAGRVAHQEQMWMPLSDQPASVITTDMPALAAAYPSVAADLKAAGLTAQQEEAYRRAIFRVGFARLGGLAPEGQDRAPSFGQSLSYAPVAPSSVLGQNLAFRAAHDAEFKALSKTGMWTIQ